MFQSFGHKKSDVNITSYKKKWGFGEKLKPLYSSSISATNMVSPCVQIIALTIFLSAMIVFRYEEETRGHDQGSMEGG